MKTPFVFPAPQSITVHENHYEVNSTLTVTAPASEEAAVNTVKALYPHIDISTDGKGDAILEKCVGYDAEGYRLTVGGDGVKIEYSESAGAFYGLITLCQLLSVDRAVPYCEIRDCAGLKIRGVLMDISRGKVPTLDTLKLIVDRLAQLKINHFELYIEGTPFAYPDYSDLWSSETPLTPDEMRELVGYCKERFIELVPCQNGLGHMARWLSVDRFRQLAECPDGFTVAGHTFPPTTLDPADRATAEFVNGLFDRLLPCFDSRLVNACLDEPFELCMGKNQGKDKYRLYADYANRLNTYLKSKGRQMMMWGDIIAKSSEAPDYLDRDIMILDWGYEAEHPFDKRARRLSESGHKFCLCPGTGSWLSFTGMTDNMLSNIKASAEAAYKHGAEGIIVTDWGDMGHLQYLPVSWAGILNAAAYAWNPKGADREALAEALNRFIFMDSAGVMGELVLDAGNYYRLEEFLLPCRSLAATVLNSGLVSREEYEHSLAFTAKSIVFFTKEDFVKHYLASYEGRTPIDGAAIHGYIAELIERLRSAKPQCSDGDIVLREYKNGLLTADAMTCIREIMLTDKKIPGLSSRLDSIISEHRSLWNIRNKAYGCEQGLAPILKIRERI